MAGIYNVSRRVGPQYFSYPPFPFDPRGLVAFCSDSEHIRLSATIHERNLKKVRIGWSRCEVVTSPRVHRLIAIRRDQLRTRLSFSFGHLPKTSVPIIKAWSRRSRDLIILLLLLLLFSSPFSVSLHNKLRTRVSHLRFWLHLIPNFFSPITFFSTHVGILDLVLHFPFNLI